MQIQSNNFVDDSSKTADDGRNVKQTLDIFTRETNIEGVNNAGRSQGSIRKYVWLLVFIVLAGLTVRDIVDLVGEYCDRPVDVATTLRSG